MAQFACTIFCACNFSNCDGTCHFEDDKAFASIVAVAAMVIMNHDAKHAPA